MARSRYPDAPEDASDELRRAWGELTRELEQRDSRLYVPGGAKWVLTNVSATTSINVSSASDTYTANVLATLIQKLVEKGII